MKEVVDSLGIVIEGLEPEQYEDEYLAVNQIPAEAILKESPVDFLVSSSSDGHLMETRNDHENHDDDDRNDDDDDHVHNIIIEGHEEDTSGMYFPEPTHFFQVLISQC